jgi:NAD(P)-dependent dehydrogenase (short-subunit alcohol dehydrogenase family)
MLKDKNILITGSSSGIGAATARLAKEYGANVILHGRDESEELKALAKELNCEYIFCDVADKAAVDSEVKRILEEVKKIDCLVNCAGVALPESFMESGDDVWLEIFKVNVLGTIHFCQSIIGNMLEQNYGRIVNISSIRGHDYLSNEDRISYSASKAEIINITASLAKLYGPHVLVNAISPGFTQTQILNSWSEKVKRQSTDNLLRRILTPKDIAEPILFLLSDKNTAITGQTILVDGGYSISGK